MLVFSQIERRVDLYICLCFVKWGGSAIYLLLVFYEPERREHFSLHVFCGTETTLASAVRIYIYRESSETMASWIPVG